MVRIGATINFWHDTWYQNCPLAIQFSLVYTKARTNRVTLQMVWNYGNIKLFLTRGASVAMK